MLKWKGKLRFHIYMKDEPTKYGVQSFISADSKTGYCWNLDIYHKKEKPEGNFSVASH